MTNKIVLDSRPKEDYVVGLIFTPDYEQVLLIRKNHPDWQTGRLNGIGGKVKDKESFTAAMFREFKEETLLKELADDLEYGWEDICALIMDNVEVRFFKALMTSSAIYNLHGKLNDSREVFELWDVNDALFNYRADSFVNGLDWILPLAASKSGFRWEPFRVESISHG